MKLTGYASCAGFGDLITVFFYAAFLGDHRGPVRFPYILHAKNDAEIIRRAVKAGGRAARSSILLQGGEVCHRGVFTSV